MGVDLKAIDLSEAICFLALKCVMASAASHGILYSLVAEANGSKYIVDNPELVQVGRRKAFVVNEGIVESFELPW